MTTGQKLKQLRKANKLTQSDLAKILYCTTPVISRYELDKTRISNDNLVALADLFNVTIDYLLKDSTKQETVINKEELEAFRIFSTLSKVDKLAVIHLIEFKLSQY